MITIASFILCAIVIYDNFRIRKCLNRLLGDTWKLILMYDSAIQILNKIPNEDLRKILENEDR